MMTFSLSPGDGATLYRQVFWLPLVPLLPVSGVETVDMRAERNKEIHSSGFCPGFSPGSLFIPPSEQTSGHLYGTKIRVFIGRTKKIGHFVSAHVPPAPS